MKKLKSVFLLGALAIGLGLTSCSSDDTLSSSTGEAKGNTYVAVSLTMPLSSGTRALPDDYNSIGKWVGNDDIKTVDIYLVDGTKADVTHSSFKVGSGTDDGYTASKSADGTQIILTPTKAIETTVGTKEVYVVLNTTDPITNALSSTSAPDFDHAYKTIATSLKNSGTSSTVSTSASEIAKVETTGTGTDSKQQDVITMTNASDVTIDVKSNVSSEQTLRTISPQNRASVQVQRAVARVMVTTAATSFDVKSSTGTPLGTVSNITWVLAQGEKSLYVQQNSGFTTPNSAWVPASTGGDADYIANAGSKYDYSGLFENYTAAPSFGGTAVPTLADYTALNEAGNNHADVLKSLGLDAKAVNGKFILPTTHTYSAVTASTGYRKGNTAYVLVRAKYTPATYADGGTANSDGTFYLGANGKYYTTGANAVDPTKGGITGQTVAKYVGGKVLYYAWVNPDQVPGWLNSPVLRNNIYHIHITGFKTIGTNWNPLYPEDPTKPSNPDPKPTPDQGTNEPTNPIDPNDPLTTPDTWMSVDVTVLPWTVHSYGVNLGI